MTIGKKAQAVKDEVMIELHTIAGHTAYRPDEPDRYVDLGDPHFYADAALCRLLTALGHSDVVEVYERVGKWYA